MELEQEYLTKPVKHEYPHITATNFQPSQMFTLLCIQPPHFCGSTQQRLTACLNSQLESEEGSGPHSHSGALADSFLYLKSAPPKTPGLLHHCNKETIVRLHIRSSMLHPRSDTPHSCSQPLARVVTWSWGSRETLSDMTTTVSATL